MTTSMTKSIVLSAVVISYIVFACGEVENGDSRGVAEPQRESQVAARPAPLTTDTSETAAQVRVCDSAPASLGFNLADLTYATNIYPIVSSKCLRCHAGDQAQQNSTTCGFLEKNIDNVIKRLENSILGDAQKDIESAKPDTDTTKLDDNEVRNLIANGNAGTDNPHTFYPMPPVNRNRGQNPAINQSDIDVLTAWKAVSNKCVGEVSPDGALPTVMTHTNDEESKEAMLKKFQTAACEDGPPVASDWAKVQTLVALPEGSESAFYDFEKKEFVAGATPMTGDCTIDALAAALATLPGASSALLEYKNYGWHAVHCAIVDGKPRAYLAHVARVRNSLDDLVYGVFLKDIQINQRQ